ncbi:hypothetical protein ANO14919_019190 [Xylariales sp. No.14919]|nr:hypothetical protein ANO14919_019190 [Xylariales sp. No.14919]
MPPRNPGGTVLTGAAATKPRGKESARPEEAEPTPAQQKKQERKEAVLGAKKRRARQCETPSQLSGNISIFETGLFTRGRPANPAYDYRASRRRKVGHGQKPARRPRWERKLKLKEPLSLSPSPLSLDSTAVNSPVADSPLDQGRMAAMCGFTDLPTEIRDEILRYILLWPHDIAVFRGWSRVYPRSRPCLNLSILYTCRMLRDQGLQILFGENTFTYALRDPKPSHDHTNPVLERVFGDSVLPIDKYGHLIRYAKVKVDRSRIHFGWHRQSFENAILKFLPGGDLAGNVSLHTLTLEIPAENCRDLDWTSGAAGEPDEVPICRYLKEDSNVGKALLMLRIQWVRVLAWDRFGKCWETKMDMRYFIKDEEMRREHKALNKDMRHATADVTSGQSTAGDAGATTCYRTKDIEAMEKIWDVGVSTAVKGLKNLTGRIELLVADPGRAAELGIWRPVAMPTKCSPESNDKGELASLPQDWREPSFRTTMPSGRGRNTPSHSNLNMSPSPEIPTKSGAEINTKARIKAETKPGDFSVFNAGDALKEAKLLEAQQGIQQSGTEAGQGGVLTKELLENPPGQDTGDTRVAHGGELETKAAEVERH